MIERPEIGQAPIDQPEIQPPTPDRVGEPIPERPDQFPQHSPAPVESPLEVPEPPAPEMPDVPDAIPQYSPGG